MLRESAADFVRGSTDTKKLRERGGTLPGYEPALLRQMAELGWFGILVPRTHGGLGLGLRRDGGRRWRSSARACWASRWSSDRAGGRGCCSMARTRT